jgi:Nif-specific regulatory protein
MVDGVSERLSLLVDLASLVTREVELDVLLGAAGERLAEALGADRATIWLIDSAAGTLISRIGSLPSGPPLRLPLGRGIAGFVAREGTPVRINDPRSDERFDASVDRATGYLTKAILAAPIRERDDGPIRGVVQILNPASGSFDDDDLRYLCALCTQLGRALALTTLRADNGAAGLVLRGPFNRIVGTSAPLADVYLRVDRAAKSDATVLLRGATGTGKGLFARAIHANSKRQTGPFVVVDCTTLPKELVESELFGHERGAFTGADRRVPGKVELARGGTLFLDEIGDLPLESQGKLLRFLQERVFERVGGRTTQEADVRIVCATHQDLEAHVAAGRFRADLYYRIRVVEIALPSLAARGEDERLLLAEHFAALYAARYDRPSPTLTQAARSHLLSHDFPGNVRELEHWMESAVVLSEDGILDVASLPPARRSLRVERTQMPVTTCAPPEPREDGVVLDRDLPLDEAARRYAVAMLAAANGNQSEAAKRLQIGRARLARLLRGE